jgi:cytochrome c oxidase subunit IV
VRTEPRFLLGAGGFAVLVGIVYWFLSYEDAGFVLLTLMGLASALIGGYLLYRGHALRRPEDDPDAEYSSDAGAVVGRFSSGSIWPLVMGIGTATALQGFIFGAWLVGFGLVIFAWAAIGLMLESRD